MTWEKHPENAAFVEVWPEARHRAALADASIRYFVIETGGRGIGFVILAGVEGNRPSVEFRRIVVAEKGRGFGTAAVRAVVRHCFETLGAEEVWLDFVEHNTRARHVYTACGFRETPGPRRWAKIAGRRTPLVVMGLSREAFAGGDQGEVAR